MAKNLHRSWCFTLNNFSDEEEKELTVVPCKYIIVGREKGDQGTPHLQGYIQFPHGKTLGGLKKINARCHWEPAVGNPQQNIEYCSKEGDFWENGTRPKIGRKSARDRIEENRIIKERSLNELVDEGIIGIKEVRAIKNARYDLAQEGVPFRAQDVRGIWIWGPPGVGKTHKARHDFPGFFIKQQNKWWDGYEGQKYVVLEDFDNPVLGHYIKIWADKWECTGEVKGATVNLKHEKFIVTSNYHPGELWKIADDSRNEELCKAIERRFEIIYMDKRPDLE